MKIQKILLQNFRCFSNLEVELHPQMNVVVGINGTGKTTMLEAIRIFTGSLFCELDKIENKIYSPNINEDDVRLHNLEKQYPVRVGGTIAVNITNSMQQLEWTRLLEKHGGKTKFENGKRIKELSKQIQSIIRQGDKQIIPLIAYYSTDRYKKEKRNTGLEADGSRLRGYYNALDSTTNIWFFLNLIKTETLWELQEGKKSVVLSLMKHAVECCVPECKDIKHDVKQDKLIITLANGERIPFTSLSDGVRSVLSLVMEMAMRCYLLNPFLETQAPAQTAGVVLIDEIDLHLHPEWQQHILNDLSRAFPRIQFIVTTHAPLVLNSLRDGEIFSITDQKIYKFPNQYMRQPEQVLQDMSVAFPSGKSQNMLDEYRLLIQEGKGHSSTAMGLRNTLENILGKNHEELQRADVMLQLF